MEHKNTKDKIVWEALNLFSIYGYDGVSMRDIAKAVGIQGASLYNHFKGKQDLFDAIILEMTQRYEETMQKIAMPQGDMETIGEAYMNINEQQLSELAKALFLYFLKDDYASRLRRMLTIEQFKNNQVKETFQNFFINGVLQFQTDVFQTMMNQGGFNGLDPFIMALHFYSPLFLMFSQYDGDSYSEECLNIIERHVHQFGQIYNKER